MTKTRKTRTGKVYWRPFQSRGIQLWHCLEKDRVYVSMCGTATADRSHGQGLNRPPLELRCPACNALEMMLRKTEESLPASPDWQAAL